MGDDLRTLVARYLDGAATSAERAVVERRLLDDDVARLLAEEVVMRDMLRATPPLDVPAEVVERWEAAVLDSVTADQALVPVERPGWFGQTLSVFGRGLGAASDALAPAGAGLARLSARAAQVTVAGGWSRLRRRASDSTGRRGVSSSTLRRAPSSMLRGLRRLVRRGPR